VNTGRLPELRRAVIMGVPMEYDCLTPAEVPHITRLYSDFLSWRAKGSAFPKLSGFYSHSPSVAGIREAARDLASGAARYSAEMRAAVADILTAQNASFCANTLPSALDRNLALLKAGAIAIVTGQQVGLFGGPAYTFYKAITALHIAAQLRKGKIEAVPIFWMATEDHDLAEINHVYWPSASGLERLEWSGDKEQEGRSVGRVGLGHTITPLVHRAVESLEGADSLKISAILETAYQPGQTFSSAFARMMAALFAEHGLILLDPMDQRFSRLAAPLFRKTMKDQSELTAALLAQNKQIEKAGYHVQVKVTERSSLLFTTLEGKRVALTRRNSGFSVGGREYSAAELDAEIDAHPEAFSPNALLRPVVQDFLLPTGGYIAGPAEIAYFAQNRVIYDALLGRAPAFLPRSSFTLIEPPAARLLKRYSLTSADVFRGRQHLRRKMERENLPRGLAARFATEEKKLERMLGGMRKPIAKLDATLVGALDSAQKKMLYQFGKLRAKAGRAAGFRTGILTRHEAFVRDSLYPQNALQERSLNLLPFLARNGLDLLDELGNHAGVESAAHCIVRL
jgi:bacillithiol biosynthesis cysteine-adding enzyme BshC